MSNESRDNVYGRTMSEWISLIPGDLPNDAVSLWHISADGTSYFDLAGAELADYLRRSILALLEAGAIPVKTGKGTPYDWIAEQRFGVDKMTIVTAILREWKSSKKDEEYLFSVWFALPDEHVGGVEP